MYCITCGEKLDDDARFCERCGTPNPACKPVTGIPGQEPAQNFQQGGQPYGQDFNQGYDQGFNQGGQYYNQNGAQGYGQGYDQNGQTYSPYMDNQQYDDPNVPPVYNGNPDYAVQEYDNNADIEPRRGRRKISKGRKRLRVVVIMAAAIGLSSGIVNSIRENSLNHDSVVVRTNDYIADDYDYDYDEPYYSFNSLNNFKNPGEVLWETDDVKVTANNVFHEGGYYSSAKVQIQIENKSSDEIRLRGEIAANDFQLESTVSSVVKPGKTNTEEFYVGIDDLDRVGIENIGEYSFWFSIQDSDYKPVASSDTVTVKTNNPESDRPVIDGYTVYNADGVNVMYSGIEEDKYSDMYVYMYIENSTDQYMWFDTNDFSVNSYTMTPSLSNSRIHPGCGSVTAFYLNGDKLKDRKINDADDIDEIEFTLTGSDTQTYDKLFTSDVIKIEN